MDSLLVREITNIKIFQDTLLHQNDVILKKLNDLNDHTSFNWVTLISVFVGGLITYLVQALLKRQDQISLVKKENRENIHKILSNIITLKFFLNELAYLEHDSKYQYHLSYSGENEAIRTRSLEEHYSDYNYIANVRAKIAENVSNINASFESFFKCSKSIMPKEIESELQNFTSHILNLKKPLEYEENSKVTREIIDFNIQNLQKEYSEYLEEIEKFAKNI